MSGVMRGRGGSERILENVFLRRDVKRFVRERVFGGFFVVFWF